MEQQISDMWAQVWVTASAGLLQCALIAGGLWMMKLGGERRDLQLDLMEAAQREQAELQGAALERQGVVLGSGLITSRGEWRQGWRWRGSSGPVCRSGWRPGASL